ncbi:uncharacterized protein LOC106883669 [Octopus bimaculoides]|uniref:uncharacterized protein LOC106883669 n=1 Tax=Octopus bimaculoides TaxID=37653 RepID=UPI00071C216C|nr:uncharacterized protein LOC106883669 [Octopus bimaculoides]XP_052826017.1 uncharacterized protein LOC106883669 [Octopus bimaculoides]XP_052826018.1 uncharacterized protein LOC106883669 [Octopus bimaculoides]|eukprot:XP_014790257.1 PREDICTED: uncharacterized protein LOC106883669 [Octopus bimaculoides]
MEKDAGTVSVDVNQSAATYESLVTPSAATYESLITPDRVERPDHIPVFAEDEDGYYRGKNKFNAHKKYVPKISYRHFSLPFRRRELVVLCSGCLLMCIALTLIITGAIRVHGCSCPDFMKCFGGSDMPSYSEDDIHLIPLRNLRNLTGSTLMDFNYALEKPCKQSSTGGVNGSMEGDSSYAVDGDFKTCSRTDVEHRPYWQVNLNKVRQIRKVILISKDTLTSPQRFDVHVGTSPNVTENQVCKRYHSVPSTPLATIFCEEDLSGRYVGIILNGTNENGTGSLVLCEVIIYQE